MVYNCSSVVERCSEYQSPIKNDKGRELLLIRPRIYVVEHSSLNDYQKLPLDNLGFPGSFLIHDAPEVHNPPKGHQRSEAVYLLDFYQGDDRILVPHLPPHSLSSRHYHKPPIIEYYWLLKGEAYLEERPVTIEGISIHPGEIHQVTTKESGVLLLILMTKARLVPEENQHIYHQT